MKNKLLYISGILLLFSCQSGKETKVEELPNETNEVTLNPQQLSQAGITLIQLSDTTLESEITFNGTIDLPPQNIISIGAKMGGYVKKTDLIPGMSVKKGQLLAVLEDPAYIELQQNYLSCKARLLHAEIELKRQKSLISGNAGSDKALQATELQYKSEKILLAALAEKLKMININPDLLSEEHIRGVVELRSPVNAYVEKVNVNIGKYVSASEVLFELMDVSDMHLNLKVLEKDIPYVSISQEITAVTPSLPGKYFSGKIILTGRNITDDRSVEVHCHFNQFYPELLPGMFMTAKVKVKNLKAKAIPEAAVQLYGDKKYVFVKKSSNTFEMKEIQSSTSALGWILLDNAAVFEGAEIVNNGAYTLLMALKNTAEE